MCRQWLDEIQPHEVMVEQATLDEMSNEQRRLYEAISPTNRHRAVVPVHIKVLHGSCCEPQKNSSTKLIDEGSGLE